MLTGTLMMGGKLGEALIGVLSALIGRFHGGPGQVGVLSSTIFGGVSGSAVADASAIGSLLIPVAEAPRLPAGVLGRHAGRGGDDRHPDPAVDPADPVRPGEQHLDRGALRRRHPAGSADVRGFMFVCWWVGRRRNFPRELRPLDWPMFRKQLVYASPALMLPVLIIIFLRFGMATPTEVAVLSTLFAGLVSALVYRDLGLKRLHAAVVEAGLATGVVLLVIMASAAIGWLLTFDRMPDGIVGWAQANLSSPWTVILMMNLLMLLCGMFIDLPAAVLLLTPVFVPLANSIGMDLTQLGIMMTVNLAIGLYTPPVGTTLFITSAIAKVKVGETVRELGPFYAMAFLILLLVSYVPAMIIK
jgi:TRAP-type C4-dicarboxylate transport system permease large subunit